eukprot:scaffold266498_cov30-Tisochrysis_lutea.AAC.5
MLPGPAREPGGAMPDGGDITSEGVSSESNERTGVSPAPTAASPLAPVAALGPYARPVVQPPAAMLAPRPQPSGLGGRARGGAAGIGAPSCESASYADQRNGFISSAREKYLMARCRSTCAGCDLRQIVPRR